MTSSRLAALAFGLALTAPQGLLAQIPDSPTGRMAGALAELASGDARAIDSFLAERASAAAPSDLRQSLTVLQEACSGGEIAGARKSGPDEATVVLEIDGGRCEVSYAIDLEDGGKLREIGIGVLKGGPGGGPGGRSELGLKLPAGDIEALVPALDRELARLAEEDRFAGVALIARDGEPVFEKAYGPADRASGRPNTIETQFDIGSITKLVTRIAAARLMQEGKLSVDDTVQEILPDYPDADVGRRVTVQHLLDHSSGLGDIFNERWAKADRTTFQEPRDFFPLFVGEPLQFEPGTGRAYSNAGFVLLGAMVEAVAGEKYVDAVRKAVFEPAGMNDSGFPVRDGRDPRRAIGYTRASVAGYISPGSELRPNLDQLPIRGCPAGSSSHTARDLLKLERALRAGKLLDRKWTSWVYTGEFDAEPSHWNLGVAGGGPGVNAVLEAGPEWTVVVVSNLDPPAAEEVGSTTYRRLLGK